MQDSSENHCALDVKKVQHEVRYADFEDLLSAVRALKGKDSDLDIDKKVVIDADNQNITAQQDV